MALSTASGAATGQNGAQYGDPNNSMAEGSQTTNGALSGQNPGSTSPGDITSGSDETHSYSGADLNQNNNGAFSPLSVCSGSFTSTAAACIAPSRDSMSS